MATPALVTNLLDRLGQQGLDQWAQTDKRLVQQQQSRLGHERPADGQHLLLSAAQESPFPLS